MSSSDPTSAIFMSDSKKEIQKKINKYAFSGGRATVEEHRELGGMPDVDVSYQYLTYFLDDDEELEGIRVSYQKGEMLTGEMKKKCIEVMQEYVAGFQARRAKVTDEVLEAYMTPRRLIFRGNPNPVKEEMEAPAKRLGLPKRPSYGIRGLSSMGALVSEMVYPGKMAKVEED